MSYSAHITVEDQEKFMHLIEKFTVEGFAMLLHIVMKEYLASTSEAALDFQKTIEEYLARNKIEILKIDWHDH